jgi:hypothetical protein
MNGATPPLPNTPSWRGTYLKHRDVSLNKTFYDELEMSFIWGVEEQIS